MAARRNSIGRNFAKAGANMGIQTLNAVYNTGYALRGLVEFTRIEPNRNIHKYGLPGTIYYSAAAVANLYSAVFESAGMLFGRPRIGGAAIAATALIAGKLAYDQGYLDQAVNYLRSSLTEPFRKSVRLPKGTEFFDDKRDVDLSRLYQTNHLFNPGLVRKYNALPKVKGYVDLIVAEAKKNDLDPVLFANQLYQESIGFRDDVVAGRTNSNKGAVGITQFLPATAKRLFGASIDDLKDWQKAIPIAAQHMGNLKRKYDGDQILAMIAYNAGDEANAHTKNPILFVQRKLGKSSITGLEWMQYMKKRRADVNSRIYSTHAWHNETFKYVAIITGASWSANAKLLAQKLGQNSATLPKLTFNIPKGLIHVGGSNKYSPYPAYRMAA